jgi:hypothetical protein
LDNTFPELTTLFSDETAIEKARALAVAAVSREEKRLTYQKWFRVSRLAH